MAISSTRDKLRLTIGDNDTDAELFQDDELDWFLSEEADSIPNAALRAAYAAMAKFARAYDFETDGQRFWRGQQYGYWADFAKRLETQGRSRRRPSPSRPWLRLRPARLRYQPSPSRRAAG